MFPPAHRKQPKTLSSPTQPPLCHPSLTNTKKIPSSTFAELHKLIHVYLKVSRVLNAAHASRRSYWHREPPFRRRSLYSKYHPVRRSRQRPCLSSNAPSPIAACCAASDGRDAAPRHGTLTRNREAGAGWRHRCYGDRPLVRLIRVKRQRCCCCCRLRRLYSSWGSRRCCRDRYRGKSRGGRRRRRRTGIRRRAAARCR